MRAKDRYSKQWEFLESARKRELLAHAYIFSGNDPRKKEFAMLFSQFLNCKEESAPCKSCASCVAIANDRHVDVTLVRPSLSANEISIAQIRVLRNAFSLRPWSSPLHIAIIEQAEKMNLHAQSAFLKLLEEPTGNVLFVLLCERPFLLLDTIRSRCQGVSFFQFVPLSQQLRAHAAGELQAELGALMRGSLGERFESAKKIGEVREDAIAFLEKLLQGARLLLISYTMKESSKLPSAKRVVKAIFQTISLLQSSNVNPRLALEVMMLQLENFGTMRSKGRT